MSFDISMEFLGLNEMQKEIERLSTESELKALNKKIIKRAGEIGLQEAEGQIRKKAYSSNPMKSGRKGSRTDSTQRTMYRRRERRKAGTTANWLDGTGAILPRSFI